MIWIGLWTVDSRSKNQDGLLTGLFSANKSRSVDGSDLVDVDADQVKICWRLNWIGSDLLVGRVKSDHLQVVSNQITCGSTRGWLGPRLKTTTWEGCLGFADAVRRGERGRRRMRFKDGSSESKSKSESKLSSIRIPLKNKLDSSKRPRLKAKSLDEDKGWYCHGGVLSTSDGAQQSWR